MFKLAKYSRKNLMSGNRKVHTVGYVKVHMNRRLPYQRNRYIVQQYYLEFLVGNEICKSKI